MSGVSKITLRLDLRDRKAAVLVVTTYYNEKIYRLELAEGDRKLGIITHRGQSLFGEDHGTIEVSSMKVN